MTTTKTVVILRGCSNAGKSTFSEFIGGEVCCADDFFYQDGEYKFDPSKLKLAHEYCFKKFIDCINHQYPKIVLANTNTQLWEFERYKIAAEKMGIKCFA